MRSGWCSIWSAWCSLPHLERRNTNGLPHRVLAALGAAACFAGSYVYARRLLTSRDTEPLVLAAAQLTISAFLTAS